MNPCKKKIRTKIHCFTRTSEPRHIEHCFTRTSEPRHIEHCFTRTSQQVTLKKNVIGQNEQHEPH